MRQMGMSVVSFSEVLVEKQEEIFTLFWKYTINNVYGMIAAQEVAEYLLREGSFVYSALKRKLNRV